MRYTELNSTTAELRFYGYIGQWWNSSTDFDNTIEDIERKYQNLHIRLHCYGGEVFEGNVIYNRLVRTKLNVTVYVDGVAASMGGVVILPAKKIVMAPNSFVMIHVPKAYTSGSANDHFAQGKVLRNMEDAFTKAFSKRTGKSTKEIAKYLDGSDHWLSADECLQMGLCDAIEGESATTEAVAKPDSGTAVESIFNRYSAIAVASEPTSVTNSNSNTMTLIEALIMAFGLQGLTKDSSTTAVVEAMKKVVTDKDAKIASLTTEVQNVKDATIVAAIASKETELGKKFTELELENFKAIGRLNPTALTTVLAAIQPVPQLQNIVQPEAKATASATTPTGTSVVATDRKTWNWATWQEKDPDGLEALSKSAKAEDKAVFKALYIGEFGEAAAADLQ